MRLFKVEFQPLFDNEEGRAIGRMMCYVTAQDPLDVPKIVRAAAKGKGLWRKKRSLPEECATMPCSIVEEINLEEGKPYSISVAGIVSFMVFAEDAQYAAGGLLKALLENGPAQLAEHVEMGNYAVRPIDVNKEGVW